MIKVLKSDCGWVIQSGFLLWNNIAQQWESIDGPFTNFTYKDHALRIALKLKGDNHAES